MTKPGGVCDRTVDFMSIYPTLCDLCGIPTPEHVEGKSIRPLLADPKAAWDQPALTTYQLQQPRASAPRTGATSATPTAEELYDDTKDPHEWTNLAAKPEYANVKEELARSLPKINVPEPKLPRWLKKMWTLWRRP